MDRRSTILCSGMIVMDLGTAAAGMQREITAVDMVIVSLMLVSPPMMRALLVVADREEDREDVMERMPCAVIAARNASPMASAVNYSDGSQVCIQLDRR